MYDTREFLRAILLEISLKKSIYINFLKGYFKNNYSKKPTCVACRSVSIKKDGLK
jgi:hypothetical protein